MEIKFTPAHQGMGFYPPTQTPAQTSAPVQTQVKPQNRPMPSLPKRPQHFAQPAKMPITPAVSTPSPVLPAPVQNETLQEFGFIYLLKRIFAFGIDILINAGLCLTALELTLWKQGIELDLLFRNDTVIFSFGFLALFNWAVSTAQEVAFKTTLGKRVFGLVFDGPASKIFYRSILFYFSVAFCGVGLIWAVFHPRRRCWHDGVVDLQPQEVAILNP